MITEILTVLPLQGKVRPYPANINLFKASNRNTRTKCEICSKLTIKTPEWRQSLRSSVLLLTSNIFHTFFLSFYCCFYLGFSAFGEVDEHLSSWLLNRKWNKSRLAMYNTFIESITWCVSTMGIISSIQSFLSMWTETRCLLL